MRLHEDSASSATVDAATASSVLWPTGREEKCSVFAVSRRQHEVCSVLVDWPERVAVTSALNCAAVSCANIDRAYSTEVLPLGSTYQTSVLARK